MIFFMVSAPILDDFSQFTVKMTLIYKKTLLIKKLHTKSFNGKKSPHKYTEYTIKDPFNNRDRIAAVAKKAVGVYIFITEDGNCYVGSSISLYARVISYFIPSIINKADRRVLRYFRKYGWNKNVTLTPATNYRIR